MTITKDQFNALAILCSFKNERGWLIPSSNSQVSGCETEKNMTRYIIPVGSFEKALSKLEKRFIKELHLPYMSMFSSIEPADNSSNIPQAVSSFGKKFTYQYNCKNRVWGKSRLEIRYSSCQSDFSMIT